MINNNQLESHENTTTYDKLLPFHNNQAITVLVSFPSTLIEYFDEKQLNIY